MSSSLSIDIAEAFTELWEPHRYKVYWGGRGATKSWAFANALIARGADTPLKILCAREIQKSIKDSVLSLLDGRIKAAGLEQYYEVLQNEIRGVNGTQFIFAGLWQNVSSIKSIEAIDICWVEEADAVSEDSWKQLIPSIRKPGSEIWVSFNPKLKSDPAYQRFVINTPPNAVVKKVSWRDNPWLSQELKDEMAHLRATDEDEYLHVYEGELKAFADGAVYGKQLKQARSDKRIGPVPIESGIPVNTFWDLGRNDTTAIWFHQNVGLQNRFIDYYESRLVDLDHYIRVLKEKDYLYGTHYLPHDVEVINLGTGNRSRKQILEEGGVKPIEVVPRISALEEGIELTRKQFATCWIDPEKCERGLEALSNYRYIFDEKWDTFRQTPVHDWASNGADAFRQFGQGYTPEVEVKHIEFTTEW